MNLELPDSVRKISDKKWLKMLIKSTFSSTVNNIEFPGFPPADLQELFVGSSNKKALLEPFAFYKYLKDAALKAKNPLNRETRFLDFGCGWGRFLRFFWKDIDAGNLFGCDVNKNIVDQCHNLNVPGQIDLIAPEGILPYRDSAFDTIMAFSVFTHLPEKIHLHWMRELARVARPGCVFCLTIEPRRFIDFIDNIPPGVDHGWHKELSKHKPRLPDFRKMYDAGNFVFLPTNEGVEETYGDAVVPLSFITKEWSPYFNVLSFLDNPRKFWQAVLVVQRK